MDKKLPQIFANKIDKEIDNNKKIYISNQDKKEEQKKEENGKEYDKLKKQINEIMKLKNKMFKIPVLITIDKKEQKKYIIGKTVKNLITFENEIIPIDKIEKIEEIKKTS